VPHPYYETAASCNSRIWVGRCILASIRLGCGNKITRIRHRWGGNKLARRLDKTVFDVRVISPANHFLFTPLLASTAVGTLVRPPDVAGSPSPSGDT
jgi:hypothetical protein